MKDIKTNFHTHVQRCRHAGGTEEAYVQAAISLGFTQLGFSDHAPFPDRDFGMRMPFCELQEYLDTLNALTVKYQTDIILWKGLEIEYLPEYQNYYEELLTTWKFDYLLMGEHFYKDAQGANANIYGPLPSTEQFLFYAHSVAEGMKSGFFKAVAHPDIYMLNHFAWDKNCEKAADIIIDTAAATGTVLEYNANGFRRKPENTPHRFRRFKINHKTGFVNRILDITIWCIPRKEVAPLGAEFLCAPHLSGEVPAVKVIKEGLEGGFQAVNISGPDAVKAIVDGDKPHTQEGEHAGNVAANCKIITAKTG